MTWQYNDGGREDAGFKGKAGDCGIRAAAIVTGVPYKEVYKQINMIAKTERPRSGKVSNSRTGVWPKTLNKFLEQHGFKWNACMSIGTGCKVHLKASELPSGKIICRVSKHFTAVVDGVIQDTFDPSTGYGGVKDGRCVYGYWSKV